MGFRLKHFEAFCNSSNSIFAAVNLLLLCVYRIVDVATMSVIHSWATKRMFARPRNSTDADECKFDSLPYRFTFCLCTVQWTTHICRAYLILICSGILPGRSSCSQFLSSAHYQASVIFFSPFLIAIITKIYLFSGWTAVLNVTQYAWTNTNIHTKHTYQT